MQALRLRLWSAYLGLGPAANRLLRGGCCRWRLLQVEATHGKLAAQETKLAAMQAQRGVKRDRGGSVGHRAGQVRWPNILVPMIFAVYDLSWR